MKFIIDNIFIIGTAFVSGIALLWPTLQNRGQKVSSLQATQLINQGKTTILDVRDAVQFNAAHLRGSKNIPLKELPSRIEELAKFKSKTLIVVCQSGFSSSKATAQLKKHDFNTVFSLDGGLDAWQAQGLPTSKVKSA